MPDRGKAHAVAGEPVDVRVKTRHALVAVRKALGMPAAAKTAPGEIIRKSPRVTVQMPFSYRLIRNDIVMPDTFSGTILNLGYQGMLAELDHPLPDASEIKLIPAMMSSHAKEMNLDARAAEIYGRVVDTRTIGEREVSGIEFTCVSVQSEQLLMHCMLHVTHGDNALLDRYVWQHEREVTKKTEAWRITERIVLVILLAVSTGFFYLLSVLNDALSAVR